MEALVRSATTADAAGLARVHTLGWQQGFAGLLPAEFLSHRIVGVESWTSRLSALPARTALHVAEREDELIGFSLAGPAPDEPDPDRTPHGRLFALYVLEDHWGTGVGHRLHAAALDTLAAGGFRSVSLQTLANNHRTNAFYRREGWVDEHLVAPEDVGGVVALLATYRYDLGRRAASQGSSVR